MRPLLDDYPDKPLVSVVIPCYNAERWLSHAILSCLEQTYRPIEVIVIDDGSTDGSLDIIKSYDTVISWETGPNRGGNAARNRGFALSKGDYIQFLDADDYLLNEKIECQVSYLGKMGVDVVYGDWQYQYHLEDGTSYLSRIFTPGAPKDILNLLLSGHWWVPNNSLLFRRGVVDKVGGWDEQFYAGQDKDFFISVVLAGATTGYVSGSFTIYRRYGDNTVSTVDRPRWFANHIAVLEKAEQTLVASDRLTPERRRILASVYFPFARYYYDTDRLFYQQLLQKTLALDPEFRPIDSWPSTSVSYLLLQALLGFHGADYVASIRRYMLASVRKYIL